MYHLLFLCIISCFCFTSVWSLSCHRLYYNIIKNKQKKNKKKQTKKTFSTERPSKLTYRKYFNQRLLDVDGRFARDLVISLLPNTLLKLSKCWMMITTLFGDRSPLDSLLPLKLEIRLF